MMSFLKRLAKSLPPINSLVQERDALLAEVGPTPPDYRHDGMRLYGKNVSFLNEPSFVRAYRAGMNSGHKIARPKGSTVDIHIEWRVHICCWAASHAKQLPGDFVECGVNTGVLSLAVCNYIDFNSVGKKFYLFDTFNGIPEEQMSPTERADRISENSRFYEECYETARRNFSPFPSTTLVRGTVPHSFAQVTIDKVCYLSIDMNIAAPEVAALTYFWERLVTGAIVVLDDYGWTHYQEQKTALDDFARHVGVRIATLPTGQGLILKP